MNPEALEMAHELFEERHCYVIVLQVVSREEILDLAEKTKEIRGACYHDFNTAQVLTAIVFRVSTYKQETISV